MMIEIFGITIIDMDFSFGEGAVIAIIFILLFLSLLASPIWKWW